MKTLNGSRRDLIDALVAESDLGGITANLLEKDEHLTDALRALFSLKLNGLQLVFCGGSCLAKAHGLIDRMSEDADIKVVLVGAGLDWSRSQVRHHLRQLKCQVAIELHKIGLVQDEQKAITLNEGKYLHSQWVYQKVYDSATSLRPNLQIELTTRTPVMGIQRITVSGLADRLAGRSEASFMVDCVCVAETLVEKVLSFLRRYAQHHAGHMAQAWDTALVRHIYDVHCICTQHPDLMTSARAAFRLCLDEDKEIFKMQHPAFYGDATAVLRQALAQAKGDAQTHLEYTHNLLPLIYGNDKPSFAQAFANFESAARLFLDMDSVPNQT